jgi:transposase
MQTEVARELGIQPSLLRRWQVRIRTGESGPPQPSSSSLRSASLPLPADQASEIAKLRRELDRTRMERNILKKAVGIFAEMPR